MSEKGLYNRAKKEFGRERQVLRGPGVTKTRRRRGRPLLAMMARKNKRVWYALSRREIAEEL